MDFKGSVAVTWAGAGAGDSSVGVVVVVDAVVDAVVVAAVDDFVLFFLVPFGFFFFKYFVRHCGLFFRVTSLQGCRHVFFRGTT